MALEVLATWQALLGELGQLGDALCSSIEAGDVLGAIAATVQLRRTRAALARVDAPPTVSGVSAHSAGLTGTPGREKPGRVANRSEY